MEKMISFCGIVCTDCPARIATVENDVAKAQALAKAWSKQFNATVTVDNVWCDGCLVGGKKCGHCHECEIRACAKEKGVANCAHCADYSCVKLTAFHAQAPALKATLDAIRAAL